jgi:hypothetical protein
MSPGPPRGSTGTSSRRCGPGGCFAVAEYARHEPERTLLHEVVRAELVPLMDPVSNAALERAVALSDATVLIVGSEHGAVPTVDRIWRLPEGRTEEPVTRSTMASVFRGPNDHARID